MRTFVCEFEYCRKLFHNKRRSHVKGPHQQASGRHLQFHLRIHERAWVSPSVREIGHAVGLASPSTVHMHLKVLQERGYIKRDSKPRTSRSLPMRSKTLHHKRRGRSLGLWVCSYKSRPRQRRKMAASRRRVAAGIPILAEQDVEKPSVAYEHSGGLKLIQRSSCSRTLDDQRQDSGR